MADKGTPPHEANSEKSSKEVPSTSAQGQGNTGSVPPASQGAGPSGGVKPKTKRPNPSKAERQARKAEKALSSGAASSHVTLPPDQPARAKTPLPVRKNSQPSSANSSIPSSAAGYLRSYARAATPISRLPYSLDFLPLPARPAFRNKILIIPELNGFDANVDRLWEYMTRRTSLVKTFLELPVKRSIYHAHNFKAVAYVLLATRLVYARSIYDASFADTYELKRKIFKIPAPLAAVVSQYGDIRIPNSDDDLWIHALSEVIVTCLVHALSYIHDADAEAANPSPPWYPASNMASVTKAHISRALTRFTNLSIRPEDLFVSDTWYKELSSSAKQATYLLSRPEPSTEELWTALLQQLQEIGLVSHPSATVRWYPNVHDAPSKVLSSWKVTSNMLESKGVALIIEAFPPSDCILQGMIRRQRNYSTQITAFGYPTYPNLVTLALEFPPTACMVKDDLPTHDLTVEPRDEESICQWINRSLGL